MDGTAQPTVHTLAAKGTRLVSDTADGHPIQVKKLRFGRVGFVLFPIAHPVSLVKMFQMPAQWSVGDLLEALAVALP